MRRFWPVLVHAFALLVQRVDHGLRVGKEIRVPLEGIVPGGGIALLNAAHTVVYANDSEQALINAIRSPYNTILDNAGLEGALLHNPVDLYYFCGGRQDGAMYISAESKEIESVQFVRRSLKRAIFEAGGDNAIHQVVKFPRLSQFFETLKSHGHKLKQDQQLHGSIQAVY